MNAIEKVIEAGRAVMELTGRKQDFWSDDDYESLNDFDVALAALRTLHEGAVEGWIGPGKTGTEFAVDDGTFTPGELSKRVILLPESEA